MFAFLMIIDIIVFLEQHFACGTGTRFISFHVLFLVYLLLWNMSLRSHQSTKQGGNSTNMHRWIHVALDMVSLLIEDVQKTNHAPYNFLYIYLFMCLKHWQRDLTRARNIFIYIRETSNSIKRACFFVDEEANRAIFLNRVGSFQILVKTEMNHHVFF